MAAYAALVSLMNLIDQLQLHPYPPISLDQKQVQSLTEKVTFLQEFLEGYSHVGYSDEADDLESRIADAANAAEVVIESHIADQILGGSSGHGEKICSIEFYNGLQNVIEDIDSIKTEVMEIKEKTEGVQHQLHRDSFLLSPDSSRSPSAGQTRTMVGFDEVLYEMLDKLTRRQPDCQIISIVGMGGMGKTTLAKNIYEDQVIVQHFDIRAWTTISQQYRIREIFLTLLREDNNNLHEMDESELGDKLHKSLSGRRYLIVIDDIWDIEVWGKMKFFFPDNKNGSRIILTTRLSELAFQISDCHVLKMKLLSDDASWNLFCENVFGKEDCPPEFEGIGRKIAKNCRGLPLSIVVIGGLLAKPEKSQEYWEHVSENLNSIVNLENDGHCLKILYMSYNSLPIYLKLCFLYLGTSAEDDNIYTSSLIEAWIAEGFLKPIVGKSFEEVAELYIKELLDRNLILYPKYNFSGKVKSFVIHDLIRDLCLREAQKQKCCCDITEDLSVPQGINTERYVSVCITSENDNKCPSQAQVLHALQSVSNVRSFFWGVDDPILLPFNFRLLRIAVVVANSLEAVFRHVNLRCLAVCANQGQLSGFTSSVSLLWNLQTLIIGDATNIIVAPPEIWKMPLLRRLRVSRLDLPDPLSSDIDGQDVVLKNLQTLSEVVNFNCSDEVVKRIPNIKKLIVCYLKEVEEESSHYCLNNLRQLHELESFYYYCDQEEFLSTHLVQNLNFPHSLKKLTLYGTHLLCADMTTKIGSLPLLQVLKLKCHSFKECKWETIEGQFHSLKILEIIRCNLEYWMTDNTHFPCLECLVLQELGQLVEIPSSIGDIPTLQSIELGHCSHSAVDSAKKILEEQEELGNVGLKLTVYPEKV